MNENALKFINSDKTFEHKYKEQVSIKSWKTKYAIKLFVFECTVEYKSVRCMKKLIDIRDIACQNLRNLLKLHQRALLF